jgi:putative flippase GtrA
MRDEGLLQRWVKFNGVGAIGIAVQLTILGWLVRQAGLHYLWATAIAVEAAVLHNFLWHEHWTWKDRPSRTIAALLARLTRFHLLNGAISLSGNLVLMRVLTGSMQVDPLGANIVAIIFCSLVNFGASELLVFRRAATVAALLLAVQPLAASSRDDGGTRTNGEGVLAVDLLAPTVQAWNTYEQRVDTRYAAMSASSSPFFALDAFGAGDWRATAMQGGVAMSRIGRARPGDADLDVPSGKIHHWAGAVFVPNTSVKAVLERLSQLAGQESKHYEEVIASRLISRDGDRYKVFLKLRRSKFGVDATYNSDHAVEYRRLGTARASARSVATRIAEVDAAGTPQERENKVGSDSGYLWRLNAYWRYEAVGNGVIIECESVSLSRGVPTLLRPFITGVVEGLARESLQRTLTGLRTALTKAG